MANEGDTVVKGQPLIQLDTEQLKRDMESYLYTNNELNAHLTGSEILLEQRNDEYNRQKKLFEKSLTSEQAYKDAYYLFKSQEASHEAMRQQVNAAGARLEKARDLLNKTTIKAPMDGVITWADVEVGEIAQAQTPYTQGKPLMVISDLSKFEVEVEIDETDIADLDIGQKAKVEIDAFPDTSFTGKVIEIGNTATTTGLGSNDQATNFKVKVALLDKNSRIRPGMSSTVDITTKERYEVPATLIQAIVMREFDADSLQADSVPAESSGNVVHAAEIEEGKENDDSGEEKEKIKKKGVFVVRDGKAVFLEVETGIADQQNIEIIEGLTEGDEVITGSFRILRRLKDGDAVKVNNVKYQRGENS
jgi:HlyD family secretion protein